MLGNCIYCGEYEFFGVFEIFICKDCVERDVKLVRLMSKGYGLIGVI